MKNYIERFINPNNATPSNMSELIQKLDFEKDVEDICKGNAFNLDLLRPIILTMMKGFNNKEVAQKLGVHRVTIQRYIHSLKKLPESEFKKIKRYVLLEDDEIDSD